MKKSSRKENSRNNSKWEKREKEKKNIQGPKGAGRDFVYSWKSVDHESGGLPTLPKRHVDVRIAGSFFQERREENTVRAVVTRCPLKPAEAVTYHFPGKIRY
jgi:hypothetical protein